MKAICTLTAAVAGLALPLTAAEPPLGLFQATADVGVARRPGAAAFDPAAQAYAVTGGGDNMWFATNARAATISARCSWPRPSVGSPESTQTSPAVNVRTDGSALR